ncbi:MAG: 6-bladed beta-propeller [Planctomycetota bacterium]
MFLWSLLFLLPFVGVIADVLGCKEPVVDGGQFYPVALKSLGLAAIIAMVSIVLGAIPGKLLAQSNKPTILLLILIVPLVLPRYVQYYAWSLLLSPTTSLGKFLSGHSELAKVVGTASAMIVLLLWYWPLAGLLLARGWKNVSGTVLEAANLETTRRQRFMHITFPLLWRNIVLCFAVCFILVLSEFSTFHLAGVKTIGTQLAVLYELTGSEAVVFRAGWPLLLISVAAGYFLHRELIQTNRTEALTKRASLKAGKTEWTILGTLVFISVIMPLLILTINVRGDHAFINFVKLHSDELAGSLLGSSAAVVLVCFLAYGAKKLSHFGRWGKALRGIVYTSIFAGMLLPGSLVGISLLKTANLLAADWSRGWWMVSAGQAVRICGVALILLELSHTADDHHIREMAGVDGAGAWSRFWHIDLPRNRHFIGAAFILLLMISVTELPATMVLLGAGVPNFAQRLLNQMHYARDDQVIASCLILISVFMIFSAAAVALLKRTGRNQLFCLFASVCFLMAGCDNISDPTEANVIRMFGKTGRGKNEFVYPRAIDLDGDTLYVIDKAGRIQKISVDGEYRGEYHMPEIEAGKPTGMSVGPEGNLYIADTHYHRIVVFDSQGKMIREFGKLGENDGEFIYPTDVAFDKNGRIFVSEYGGNDRISVFDKDGCLLFCFGELGNGKNQFSRPSAMCIDPLNEVLYIADACNHRIAVYTLEGELVRYLGRLGGKPGCLRYPYDLALSEKGDLVICEYGNNRIQILSPQGQSRGVYGRAGRNAGELAYPWGVAVDQKYAYIVDAGNNRIQVWEF